MLIAAIILAILLLLLIVLFAVYNSLVRGRNQCSEALSTMDVYLKQRFDLVPNLVSTVKGYAAHEAETLENSIKARSGAANTEARMTAESRLSGALRNVLAVGESYPQLKASDNFATLQRQLQKLEEDIAEARKYYNGCVREYNNRCMVFPANLVAKLFGFVPMPLYELSSNTEAENVKVEF